MGDGGKCKELLIQKEKLNLVLEVCVGMVWNRKDVECRVLIAIIAFIIFKILSQSFNATLATIFRYGRFVERASQLHDV